MFLADDLSRLPQKSNGHEHIELGLQINQAQLSSDGLKQLQFESRSYPVDAT